MNLDRAAGRADRVRRHAQSQVGLVALLAQMQQDHVLRRMVARIIEHRLDQLRPLVVGQMAVIAQVPLDQEYRRRWTSVCMATSWLNSTPSTSTSASASAIASDHVPESAR